ncbi:MAG: SH3 domain-containing protein [Aquificaceae bacterium]
MWFLIYAFPLIVFSLQAERVDHMKIVEDFPQWLDGSLVREWIDADSLPAGKFYVNGKEATKSNFIDNRNLESIKDKVEVLFGWTTKRTSMKMYPTDVRIHSKNRDIDYNQYTLLEPFTFLAIVHVSKDGEWFYAHSPFMRGWVKKKDVKIVSKEELVKVGFLKFLIVKKSKVRVGDIEFGLGSKIPYVNVSNDVYHILLPDGSVGRVYAQDAFSDGYEKYSEEKLSSILESLLGEPYDWGGERGYRDCSALVRDVFAVFGLELPRNSNQQMQVGIKIKGEVKSYGELKETLKVLPPYRTLVFMKGHVMVYGGIKEDDIVFYHALYSIKKDSGEYYYAKRVVKSMLERDGLTNIYRRVVSINLLP